MLRRPSTAVRSMACRHSSSFSQPSNDRGRYGFRYKTCCGYLFCRCVFYPRNFGDSKIPSAFPAQIIFIHVTSRRTGPRMVSVRNNLIKGFPVEIMQLGHSLFTPRGTGIRDTACCNILHGEGPLANPARSRFTRYSCRSHSRSTKFINST